MRFKAVLASGILSLALISACGSTTSTPTAPTSSDHSPMPGMDAGHSADTSGQPFDASFIDSMIVHHQGAIAMANQALTAAEHPEIKQLAQAIISAQQSEISQLQAWRTAWYPDLAKTDGMGMDMGAMSVADGSTPFDQRFIEAMIPHHESAISMARDALQKAERQEIKTLAQKIITAQEGEITQMRQWLKAWYGIDS